MLPVVRGGLPGSLPTDSLILDPAKWVIHRIKLNGELTFPPYLIERLKRIDPSLKIKDNNTLLTTKADEVRNCLRDNNFNEYTEVEDHSLRANLVNLRHRGVDLRYYRDANTGLLQRLDGFFEKIWYFINPYYRRTIDAGVAEAVSDVLKQLGNEDYQLDSREDHGHREILSEFFMRSKFVRLPPHLYNRAEIPKKIIRILQGVDFRNKKAERKDSKGNASRIIGFDPEYKYRLEKVKFAQSLGVEIVRNKAGSSGNYTGRSWQSRNEKRKPLLIIKPYDEGPDSHLNPNVVGRIKNFIWKYIPFVARRTCYYSNHNPVQEAASSFMDKRFDLGVIPFTHYEESFESKAFHGVYNKEKISKHASCTVFVKDVDEAYDVLELIKPKWWLPFQIPLVVQRFFMGEARIRELNNKLRKDVQFDNVVIAHIAAGNGDGHPANYLIRKQLREDGSRQLIAIDFGWAFPHSHPSDALALRFMYDFRHLPQADMSFEETTFEKIGNIRENIKIHLKSIRDHLQTMTKANHDVSGIREWPMPVRPDPASLQIRSMWQRLQPLFKAYDDNEELKKERAELVELQQEVGKIPGYKERIAQLTQNISSLIENHSDVDEENEELKEEKAELAELQDKVGKKLANEARITLLTQNIAILTENLKISKIADVRSSKDFEAFFQRNLQYSPTPPDLDA